MEAKLGSKMEPRSIQNGVEKTIEKRRAPGCTESRNMTPRPSAAPRVQGPGEGVGGGETLPEGRRERVVGKVADPKPLQPEGLVGFSYKVPGDPRGDPGGDLRDPMGPHWGP